MIVKPNNGTNKKRSFINVPRLKKRLETIEKVMIKNKIPNETTCLDLSFLQAYKMIKMKNRIRKITAGLAKLVISICFG